MNKTINLNLDGLDGNAFALLGAFRHQAKREGWAVEEIDAVITKATSGDYEHLVNTLDSYCDPQEQD